MKVISKITCPSGKIYIGKDLTDSIKCFGGPASELIAADVTREQRRDFAIRRQITRESNTATDDDVSPKKVELIRQHRANNPRISYKK